MSGWSSRRLTIVVAAALAAGLGGALPAVADTAGPGSTVTFSGSGGDYITQDRSWSYDPTNSQITASVSADGDRINLGIDGDTWWYLDLAAPAGQRLTAGVTYEGATRYPFREADEPGLELSGDGRGCNQLSGSFVVRAADFGDDGSIELFDATFEQHCENSTTSVATGRVFLTDGTTPVGLTVDAEVTSGTFSRVSGRAQLTGTLTCSRDAEVDVAGTLAQRISRGKLATGSWAADGVDCGPTPTTWTATVVPDGSIPFGRGLAQLDATATASDAVTGVVVTDVLDTELRLRR